MILKRERKRASFFLAELLLALSFPISTYAIDGVLILENIFGYHSLFENGGTAANQRSIISSETNLGYTLFGFCFLGGTLHYTYLNEVSGSDGSRVTYQQAYQYYGPSLGLATESVILLGHWYPYTEHRNLVTQANGSSLTYVKTGSGYGASLAYIFSFSTFSLAPMISYRSINFDTCRDPNTGITAGCNPNVFINEVTPYLSLILNIK